MPAVDINELDAGHPDEKGDCCLVALKAYLGIPYTESLRAATVLDAEQGRKGLWTATVQKIAAQHGHKLVQRRVFDWDDAYGILLAPRHAAVLRGGLVLDRWTVWPPDAWCSHWQCDPEDCVLLVAK